LDWGEIRYGTCSRLRNIGPFELGGGGGDDQEPFLVQERTLSTVLDVCTTRCWVAVELGQLRKDLSNAAVSRPALRE